MIGTSEELFTKWLGINDLFAANLQFSYHHVGNIYIEFYVDHFQRREGRWRILLRTSFPESASVTTPPQKLAMLFDPGWARGTRDANDPAQLLRRELGVRS